MGKREKQRLKQVKKDTAKKLKRKSGIVRPEAAATENGAAAGPGEQPGDAPPPSQLKPAKERKAPRGATYPPPLRVLVVGDGDFSFGAGLIRHRGGRGDGLTITSYDSLALTRRKYERAEEHVGACAAARARVLHGVDATVLESVAAFSRGGGGGGGSGAAGGGGGNETFERIVFNFPHCGQQRVHLNRALIGGFFESARPFLTRPGGELHITIKLGPPCE